MQLVKTAISLPCGMHETVSISAVPSMSLPVASDDELHAIVVTSIANMHAQPQEYHILVLCAQSPGKALTAQLCHALLMQRLFSLGLNFPSVHRCLCIILVKQRVQLIWTAVFVGLVVSCWVMLCKTVTSSHWRPCEFLLLLALCECAFLAVDTTAVNALFF